MKEGNYSEITCKVCNQTGAVKMANIRRMSGPVVAIGYIFLVPSVMGMFFGVLMLFASGKAGGDAAEQNRQEYAAEVQDLGLTSTQVDYVLTLDNPQSSALIANGLTPEQATDVLALHLGKSAGDVGAGAGAALGVGFGLTLIIGSFVAGLLGWLLTMKKSVLLCGNCKGIHADAA